jgi:hypothetical protein
MPLDPCCIVQSPHWSKVLPGVSKLILVSGFPLFSMCILPCLPVKSPGMAGLRRRKEVGAQEATHPISLEDLQHGPVNVVLRISVQVRTWEMSCLAGITDGWRAVCGCSRSWPLLTLGQLNSWRSRNCNECESASSCENGLCGRLWRWWLCHVCLEPRACAV